MATCAWGVRRGRRSAHGDFSRIQDPLQDFEISWNKNTPSVLSCGRRLRRQGGLQVQWGQPPKIEGTGEGSGHAQSAAGRPSLKVDMHSSGKSWLLLTGCVVFYVIYLLFGAMVFSTIERPMEEKLLQELEVLKQEFLNESCASSASLERLLVKALAASRSGVSVLRNSSSPSNWDLASSMFFANTLVTTVGEFHTDNQGRKRHRGVFARSPKLQFNDTHMRGFRVTRFPGKIKDSLQTFNKPYFTCMNSATVSCWLVFSCHVSQVRRRIWETPQAQKVLKPRLKIILTHLYLICDYDKVGAVKWAWEGELHDGTQNEECPTTDLITLIIIIGSIFSFIIRCKKTIFIFSTGAQQSHLSGCKCKSVSFWLMEDSLIHTEQISLKVLGALMTHNIQRMLNQSKYPNTSWQPEAQFWRISV